MLNHRIKTFISKSNTIISDSKTNLGLNPILEINWNGEISRGLIYFDHTKLQCMVNDSIYPDITKFKHILKLTNCASVNIKDIDKQLYSNDGTNNYKKRASSFDLIFFLLPKPFDSGRGFDYNKDLYIQNQKSYSTSGSNWFYSKNNDKWEYPGVYSTDILSSELDKYTSKNGNMSKIIIGYEHFDYGNESISVDITDTVNKFLTGELENNGIGIAVSPKFENCDDKEPQYVGFFTHRTHSFFEPYLETTYEDYVCDDRNHFYLNKDNKLYFYAIIGGKLVNLDKIPKCEINGNEFEVKQTSKGLYYVDVNLSSLDFEPNTMYYDKWFDIFYNNHHINDITLDFVTIDDNEYFQLGIPSQIHEDETFIPSINGIGHNEKIKRGDVRTVHIDCRKPFTKEESKNIIDVDYRLFVKEGVDEYDVIPWTKVDHFIDGYSFIIDTNELVPFRYFIDIKITTKNNIIIHHKKNSFDIINDVSEFFN